MEVSLQLLLYELFIPGRAKGLGNLVGSSSSIMIEQLGQRVNGYDSIQSMLQRLQRRIEGK